MYLCLVFWGGSKFQLDSVPLKSIVHNYLFMLDETNLDGAEGHLYAQPEHTIVIITYFQCHTFIVYILVRMSQLVAAQIYLAEVASRYFREQCIDMKQISYSILVKDFFYNSKLAAVEWHYKNHH